jgi:hypothetical protein
MILGNAESILKIGRHRSTVGHCTTERPDIFGFVVVNTDDQSIQACAEKQAEKQVRLTGLSAINLSAGWALGRKLRISAGRWITLLVMVAHGPLKLSGRRWAERNDWAS